MLAASEGTMLVPLGPGAVSPQAGESSWPARGRDRPRPRGLGVPRPEGGGARRSCSGPRGGGLAGALGQRPRQRPGFAARLGGPDRTLYAALFAAGLAWALHAGVDWDWQMPAVTLWVFALGGAALAAPARAPRIRFSPPLALRAAIGAALTARSRGFQERVGAPLPLQVDGESTRSATAHGRAVGGIPSGATSAEPAARRLRRTLLGRLKCGPALTRKVAAEDVIVGPAPALAEQTIPAYSRESGSQPARAMPSRARAAKRAATPQGPVTFSTLPELSGTATEVEP